MHTLPMGAAFPHGCVINGAWPESSLRIRRVLVLTFGALSAALINAALLTAVGDRVHWPM